MIGRLLAALCAATTLVLMLPGLAYGYLGPGGVISGFGALIALVGAVAASVVGFLWFPIKRVIRRLRSTDSSVANLGSVDEA